MGWKQKVEKRPGGVLAPSSDTRFDKLPPLAMLAAAKTMAHGMKYEQNRADNWRQVPAWEHWDHAMRHFYLYKAGDRTEEHVAHVLNRVIMWADLELSGGAK